MMGSSDLLQLVTSIHCPVHIKDYAGKKVAVDGRAWRRRCLAASAADCATANDEGDGSTYIDSFLAEVDALCSYGVTPLIVFQGRVLPCNKDADEERQRDRVEAEGQGLKDVVQQQRADGAEHLQKAAHVTWAMDQRVMKHLHKKKIKHIVAPYEVDAQLAYLAQRNLVDAIITDDQCSDLLAFGCGASATILFRLDDDGHATALEPARLGNAEELDLADWSQTDIRHLCLLSGVQDPLPPSPLANMGLKAAHALLMKHKHNMDAVFKELGDYKYEKAFRTLESERFGQRVRDIKTKRIVSLKAAAATTATTVTRASLGTNTNNTSEHAAPTTTSTARSLDKGTPPKAKHTNPVKSIGQLLSTDNKENLPPWLQPLDDSKEEPPHRPRPPQPVIAKNSLSSVNNPNIQKQPSPHPHVIAAQPAPRPSAPASPVSATASPPAPPSSFSPPSTPQPASYNERIVKKRERVNENEGAPAPKKTHSLSRKARSSPPSARRLGLADHTNQ